MKNCRGIQNLASWKLRTKLLDPYLTLHGIYPPLISPLIHVCVNGISHAHSSVLLSCSMDPQGYSALLPTKASTVKQIQATALRWRTNSTKAANHTSITTAKRGNTRGTQSFQTCVDRRDSWQLTVLLRAMISCYENKLGQLLRRPGASDCWKRLATCFSFLFFFPARHGTDHEDKRTVKRKKKKKK